MADQEEYSKETPSAIMSAGSIGLVQEAEDHRSTVTETLERKRLNLQKKLDRVDAALAALKANPEIEKVMNLIQQASY
jgi:hypothetical protein